MTDTLNIKSFIVTGNNISQRHDLFGKLSAPSIADTLLPWRVFLTNWFTVKNKNKNKQTENVGLRKKTTIENFLKEMTISVHTIEHNKKLSIRK